MTVLVFPRLMRTMGKLAAVAQCTDSDAETQRAPTPDEMSALFQRVAAAATLPAEVVRAVAHVARVLRRCPWLDGDLCIELSGAADASSTIVHLFTEYGGVRTRALPDVVLDLALDDIDGALQAAPELFAGQNVVSTRTLS
ncbi:MAG: hypothetical protein JWP87_3702 [Labilithrix sp.]|nr:hypothetical protein [Labilithrix sp.]